MSHPADFHQDFPVCPYVQRVMDTEFREPALPAVYGWLRKNAMEQVPDGCLGENIDAKKAASHGLLRMKHCRPVVYKYASGCGMEMGRLYADNSSQNLWEGFRSAVFKRVEGACDVDIVNAHPTLLSQFCRRLGIPAPCLDKYVDHRAECLDAVAGECNVDRAAAKQLFCRLINLGGVSKWMRDHRSAVYPPLADEFGAEMKRVAAALKQRYPAALYKAIQKGKKRDCDPDARFVSYILGDLENRCLCAAVCGAMDAGKEVVSLIFDGFIAKNLGPDDLELLSGLVLQRTGFVVEFKIKPFENAVAVPDEIGEDDSMNVMDLTDFLYNHAPEVFDNVRHDPDSKMYYLYRDGIWAASNMRECRRLFELQIRAAEKDLGQKNADKAWDAKGTLFEMMIDQHCLDTGFTERLDRSITIFPFANCCYDFTEHRFRDYTREDCVSMTTGYDYKPGCDQATVRRFQEQLFPFEDERKVAGAFGAYIINPKKSLKKMGCYTDTDHGNTGKSKQLELQLNVCGDLAMSGQAVKKLLQRSTMNDGNGHDAGKLALRGKFFIAADEMDPKMSLDTSTLKEWTAGSSAAKVSGRNFGRGSNFSFQMKAVPVFSFNKGMMPNMGGDGVFYDRVIFLHYRAKFIPKQPGLDGEAAFIAECAKFEYPHEALDIDGWLGDVETRSAAFDYFLACTDNFHMLTYPPESCTEFRTELVRDDNPMTEFFDTHFEVTHDPAHFVLVNEINQYIHTVREDRRSAVDVPNGSRYRKTCFENYARQNGLSVQSRMRIAGEQHRNVVQGMRFG